MTAVQPGVTEAQTLTADVETTCDVVIIGSGPGGAVTASVLAKAGLQVVVLEEGGHFTRQRFRGREDEAYPQLYQEAGQRTTKDLGISILQGRAVGGGSVVNWTTCFRTPDAVVEHWRTHHNVTGVSAEVLAPHFQQMEQRLGIAKVPLEAVNRNNRLLYDGCTSLGMQVETIHRNVVGCAQSGHCGHGCPIDAKQSMLVTCLKDAVAAGAVVFARARVDRVVFEGTQATRVEASALDAFGLSATGKRVTVKPRLVVVSGGAINSPAVLLRSGAPDPYNRLGLRTFLHPVVVSVPVFAEKVEGWRGAPQSVASHHHVNRGEEVGFLLETAPIHPLLGSLSVGGFGPSHQIAMGQLAHFSAQIALTIDGFHPDVPGGTVSVTPSGAPVLDYTLVQRQWRALRDAQKVLARVGFAGGALNVMTAHDPRWLMRSAADIDGIDALPWEPGRVGVFSAHQMGGCAMGDDPKQAVVRSEDLRHHQVTNLHVVDGSVFPTSLGVNPQLSIYGLSHLMASRLAAAMKA